MRLAYKELEIDRKLEEKKLRNLEGKKKEQAERLGMGLGTRRYQIRPGVSSPGAPSCCSNPDGDLHPHAFVSASSSAPCLTQ